MRTIPESVIVNRCVFQTFVVRFGFVGAMLLAGIGSLPAESPASQKILQEHCVECHGPSKQRGGLRFDRRDGAFAESDSGEPAIVPGDATNSELLRLVESLDEGEQMPPEGPRLRMDDISTLRRWIVEGAVWPKQIEPTGASVSELLVTEKDRQFWSFRPLDATGPPEIRSPWIRNPIDQFVLQKLREAGLKPNASSSNPVLLRRMHFDVIGLPPSERDVRRASVAGSSLDAKQIAASLLGNPHFGEHWARHWLDVARYADSAGYEGDADRNSAYQYRDFVIRAFNNDLPFDRFVRWQLAGDELAPENPNAIAATGFLVIGPEANYAPTAPVAMIAAARYDELNDIVATTSEAFLGLTLACARCHDHKYDPIPSADYYSMVTAFANTSRHDLPVCGPKLELEHWVRQSRQRLVNERIKALDCTSDERKWLAAGPRAPGESGAAFRKFGKRLEFTDREWRLWLSDDDRNRLSELTASAKGVSPEGWVADNAFIALDRSAMPESIRLLRRGDVRLPGKAVDFGFLTVLTHDQSADEFLASVTMRRRETTGQRAALAQWITDTEQGAGDLVARVAVNRIWSHYFRRGLVTTPNDFGAQGQRPTHPGLLDWLASELIANDWRTKHIHRLILGSSTYQQSSEFSNAKHKLDPDNKLLWRRLPKRLDAEQIRDTVLATGQRLNSTMYGPGVRPFIPTSAMATRSPDKWPRDVSDGPAQWRRSIYVFVKRSVRFPMMEAFDSPDPTTSCGRRIPTTSPVQALALMNNPFVSEAAGGLAAHVRALHGDAKASQQECVESMFLLAIGRHPTSSDLELAAEFLRQSTASDPLKSLAHSLFLLNEFVYLP